VIVDSGRKVLLVVVGIERAAEIILVLVALAGSATAAFFGASQSRQNESSENSGNRDDDTKFNQGKANSLIASVSPALEERLHNVSQGLVR
jgi:hypothetical protein